MTHEASLLFFYEWATNGTIRGGDEAIASSLIPCGTPVIQRLARKVLDAQKQVLAANNDLRAAKATLSGVLLAELPEHFKISMMEKEAAK
jgi:hypothetical protein